MIPTSTSKVENLEETLYIVYGASLQLTESLNNTSVFWSFISGWPQKHVLGTKQVKKNHVGLIFWCIWLQIALRVYSVLIGTLGLRRFGDQANSSVLHSKNNSSQGKFAYHIGAPDAETTPE